MTRVRSGDAVHQVASWAIIAFTGRVASDIMNKTERLAKHPEGFRGTTHWNPLQNEKYPESPF